MGQTGGGFLIKVFGRLGKRKRFVPAGLVLCCRRDGSDAEDFEIADFHVAESGAEAEVTVGIWGGVVVAEDAFIVAVIFDEAVVSDELNGLPGVGGEEKFFGGEVVFGKEGTVISVADVAAEAGGGVGVAALANVI